MLEFRKIAWPVVAGLKKKKKKNLTIEKRKEKEQAGIDIVTNHRSNRRFEGHNYSPLILQG